jgi:hypothetical protein
VPESFTAHLNPDGQQSIAAPEDFQAGDDFTVYLRNHGPPLHTHLKADRSLGRVAEVATPNRYVEEGATQRVQIEITGGNRPVEGELEIVTGYGSNTEHVSVTVQDPNAAGPDVEVGEELTRPTPSAESGPLDGDTDTLARNAVLGVGLLLVFAIAIVTSEPLVIIAGLLVLVGVMAAGYLLVE